MIYLMHGFIASGKTTKAKELEREYNAIRFTPDEWMCSLYGEDSPEDDFNKRLSTLMELFKGIWLNIAEKQDVLLDYGFWTKQSRDNIEAILRSYDLKFKWIIVNTSIEECRTRNKERNSSLDKTLHITENTFELLLKKWEPIEEVLDGGNMNVVVRVGDTVRRPLQDNSLNIHKLLKFLEDNNYNYSPKFYGIDDQNREILSFIDGIAGNDYDQEFIWSDDNLKIVASKLREFHDITEKFVPVNNKWLLSCPDKAEVICHNDFAPYNTVFKNKKAFGVIDFDTCSPGSRKWDIAYTVFSFIPLTSDKYKRGRDSEKIKRRIQLFCDTYGYDNINEIVETSIKRIESVVCFIEERASLGDDNFIRMKKEGHADYYKKQIEFIKSEKGHWV